jgi:hypothetical protein
MAAYFVEVDVRCPSMGNVLAKRSRLVEASSWLEAQQKTFRAIKEEFGDKRTVKVCRNCEELT